METLIMFLLILSWLFIAASTLRWLITLVMAQKHKVRLRDVPLDSWDAVYALSVVFVIAKALT